MLAGADWIILPGSKNTSGDLAWLREQGLDRAVARARGAAAAPCSASAAGLQMLGEALIDPHGVDGNAPGLGLLPLVTLFAADKTVRHREASIRQRCAGALGRPGRHHGARLRNPPRPDGRARRHGRGRRRASAVMPDELGWQNAAGNVLGLYLHGLFEDPAALQALFGAAVRTLDTVFDGLADHIDTHFQPGVLRSGSSNDT